MAANHGQYNYKNARFSLLPILKQVILLWTLSNTRFFILMWVFMKNYVNNEMII